jgi:GNAT superfamily N-acetyltransferase
VTGPTGITISVGLPDPLRDQATVLYLEAFGQKLGPVLGHDARATQFLTSVQRPSQAIVAMSSGGQLLGIAGFHDRNGGFIGGSYRDIARVYGHVGAVWRAIILSIFDRDVRSDHLLMDGVVVEASQRGNGIGTLLLTAIEDHARKQAKTAIRLDVVDTNPRARALYERRGYAATRKQKIPFANRFFGFRTVTTMIRHL